MTDLNDFFYTDGIHDVLAAYVNQLVAGNLRGELSNIETLTANKTLTDASFPIQSVVASGADRDVILPAVAAGNHGFMVINRISTAYSINVKNAGGTIIHTLRPGAIVFFASDGTNGWYSSVSFAGSTTYWQDIDFPIIIRTTGANIPTLTTVNGNLTAPQWAVNDFNMCESQELVHDWKEASPVYWHLHLTTNGLDATNRYVRFQVEYGYVTPSGVWVWPATIDSGDLLIPANTTTKTMSILSLGSFTPAAGTHIGGHVLARLKRIAATGTAPTSSPWIPMLQLHIECDSVGSKEISSK